VAHRATRVGMDIAMKRGMTDHKRWIKEGDRQGKRVGAPDDTDRAQRPNREEQQRKHAADKASPSTASTDQAKVAENSGRRGRARGA
jgi:hypothetical protein